jgi:carbamoyltransferase
MIILGVNGGVRLGYQDVSASLIIDGRIVAAVEEERINRIKFSPGQLPFLSIKAVLNKANISIYDVDYVATHGSTWGKEYLEVLKGYFKYTFGHCPAIEAVHHHNAHAASSYYPSGFDEAMVVTIDNSGDGVSTQLAIGRKGKLEEVSRFSRPNSLGIFYSLITQYCGFVRDSDEYKLMGLAAYGQPDIDLSWLLSWQHGSYSLNDQYLKKVAPSAPQPTRQQTIFNESLIDKLGRPPLMPGQQISSFYKNLASSAQLKFEEILIRLVTEFHQKTGLRKLCLAGGAALNCVANQKLMNLDFIDEIYVQPASGDSGISLGAACYLSNELGFRPSPNAHTYLGEAFDNQAIEDILKLTNNPYDRIGNPAAHAARLVAENKTVGWFQGSAEFGPRALGNRSILANPANPRMAKHVNKIIKYRESFRPFCPSVLEEDAMRYFEGKQARSPHMTITYDVNQQGAQALPAVTHEDNTARIQTVCKENNAVFYQYLRELKKLTGHGVTLNTSFNVNGEPMVYKPVDAIRTFYGSGLDSMVIGNFLLNKQR